MVGAKRTRYSCSSFGTQVLLIREQLAILTGYAYR